MKYITEISYNLVQWVKRQRRTLRSETSLASESPLKTMKNALIHLTRSFRFQGI